MPDAEPVEARSPRKRWLRWLVLAFLIAAIGVFYVLGLHEYFDFDRVKSQVGSVKTEVDEHFVLALVAFFFLYTIMTAFSVPAAGILTLVAGALFGRFLGAGAALLAATVGATLAFMSSRFLLGEWVQGRFGKRLDAFNRGFEKDGAFYLFSLRLVPLFPFFLINLGMGLTPIRTWTYFWVSLLGMMPGSLLYANAGAAIGELKKASDVLTPGVIVSLVLLGVAPLAFRYGIRWLNYARQRSNGRG